MSNFVYGGSVLNILADMYPPAQLVEGIRTHNSITNTEITHNSFLQSMELEEHILKPLVIKLNDGLVAAVRLTPDITTGAPGNALRRAIANNYLQTVEYQDTHYVTLGNKGAEQLRDAGKIAQRKQEELTKTAIGIPALNVQPQIQTIPDSYTPALESQETIPGLPVMDVTGQWFDSVTQVGMAAPNVQPILEQKLPHQTTQVPQKPIQDQRTHSLRPVQPSDASPHKQTMAFQPVTTRDKQKRNKTSNTTTKIPSSPRLCDIINKSTSYGSLKLSQSLSDLLGTQTKDFIRFGQTPLSATDVASNLWETYWSDEKELAKGNMLIVKGYKFIANKNKKPAGALQRMATTIGFGSTTPPEHSYGLAIACLPTDHCKQTGFSIDSRMGKGTAHFALNILLSSKEEYQEVVEILKREPETIIDALSKKQTSCKGLNINLARHYRLKGSKKYSINLRL